MGRFARDWLLESAAAKPDDEAVFDGHRRWSNAQLVSATLRIATSLHAAGAGAGSRVALLLGDSADAVAAVHAIRRLGAVLVPLNRRATAAELAYQVGAADVTLLIHDAERASLGNAVVASQLAVTPLEIDLLLASRDDAGGVEALRDDVDLDTPATILFTSGTTGRPKGAILTHRSLVASADAWAAFLQPRPSDRWLACVPFFHIAGLAIIARASRWGVPLEVHARFDPGAVYKALERGVSHLSVVGPMLEQLLAIESAAVPRSLRAVLLGGGPISPEQVRRATERGYPVVPTYGLTETASGVAALPPDAVAHRPKTVGRALPGVQLRIDVDDRPARAGEVGEILVRGPMVFAGYAGSPEGTAHALRDGWLHTGDFGTLDDDGYLTVVDRRDDLIISGGENVYPSEVEAALLAHASVVDAAVLGRPDARWGAVPVAVIVLRAGTEVSDQMLSAHCRTRLAGFKAPVAFVRLPALPRTPSGKLLRSAIGELLRDSLR